MLSVFLGAKIIHSLRRHGGGHKLILLTPMTFIQNEMQKKLMDLVPTWVFELYPITIEPHFIPIYNNRAKEKLKLPLQARFR
jgi:hypothetical protein